MKRTLTLLAIAAAVLCSCQKEQGGTPPAGPEGGQQGEEEPEIPDIDYFADAIVIDLQFYNGENVNPLGFGDLHSADESAEGEVYEYQGYPITICKGKQSGASYNYRSRTLVYPEGAEGCCLAFSDKNGWIKLPGIEDYHVQSVTYEHGNAYVKRMVIKKSLDPSVSLAFTFDDDSRIATAAGPNSETISFHSNGKINECINDNPGKGEPVWLQFIGNNGTRVYRIKAVYTRELPPVPGQTNAKTGFPTVKINTTDNAPIESREEYVTGSIEYSDPEGVNPGGRKFAESDVAQFRGRGNTTWNRFPKKPYKIKLGEKAPLFGLHADREWCLLANYSDKSMLRNSVGMKVSTILGMDWTPQMYPVELWLNGTYNGVYFLSEHKKVSKGRVNISTPDKGGRDMYLEIDQLMDETTCFKTERYGVSLMFSDPEVPDDEMLAETKAWFKGFEDALASEPVGRYSEYIDVPSFINHYIIQELSKNVDGRMNKSTFLSRTQGGPAKICHEWDFDIAFGNSAPIATLPGVDSGPTGFVIKDFTGSLKNDGWYPRMFTDPAFVSAVKARWNEVYPELCHIPEYIDEQAAILAPAAARNYLRWPTLGRYIWPNVSWPATYDEEIANLKSFYSERLAWLNENINLL